MTKQKQTLTVQGLARSGKVRNLPERAQDVDPRTRVKVIAKVRTPGYVPDNVRVRTRVDPNLFTAECALETLQDLEADPEIESIEVAETLPPIDKD